MKRYAFMVTLSLGWLAGCATLTPQQELGAAVRRHTGVGLNHVFYMGTRREHHLLLHQHAFGSRTYRVSRDELVIEPEFPFTRDENAWRLLTERWWPEAVSGEPLVFRKQEPVRGEAAGTFRLTPLGESE